MAARFSTLCLICFVVPLYTSSVLSHNYRSAIEAIFRSRRGACVDGTYELQGRPCCLCSAGQRVEKPCSVTPDDRQCKICEIGTYNSEPNLQDTCQPCTSCTQTNANLEEEEPCTIARNTKCRCKKDHFCVTEECTICHPCKTCGIGGIKEACTLNKDTVCNDDGGAVFGIVFAVLIVAGIIVGVICWTYVLPWRRQKKMMREKQTNKSDVDLLLLPDDFNIEPLLPDIANVIGWTDMKDIAIRTGVTNVTIESIELDYKNNTQERTLQLLRSWVEREAEEAPKKLIQTLKKTEKRSKAQKISDIFSKSASSNNSGTNN